MILRVRIGNTFIGIDHRLSSVSYFDELVGVLLRLSLKELNYKVDLFFSLDSRDC